MKCPKCNIPIQEHPANACLDALFAKLVMGWELDRYNYGYWNGKHGEIFITLRYQWTPSTNIAHAMEGVEKVDRSMALRRHINHKWACIISNDPRKNVPIWAETASLAITRALILWAMEKK